MFSLGSFLLRWDRLGHPFALNYKGETSHQTRLGAFLSIGISLLVLIILLQKTIELVNMTDPNVQLNSRSIFQEEVEEAGLVSLDDYKFNIGIVYMELNQETHQHEP